MGEMDAFSRCRRIFRAWGFRRSSRMLCALYPIWGNDLLAPEEAMLFGPLCVSGLGSLAEFGGGPVEHKPEVYVRVALLDAEVLGTV